VKGARAAIVVQDSEKPVEEKKAEADAGKTPETGQKQ
jgi:hypothetical protein